MVDCVSDCELAECASVSVSDHVSVGVLEIVVRRRPFSALGSAVPVVVVRTVKEGKDGP